MKEAAITRSPHAFVPKDKYTEKEREELYRTRLDESFKPYTVIDVITKVYHRSFEDDLRSYIGENPNEFKTTSDEWTVARAWVNDLQIIRPESVLFQQVNNFIVDVLVDTKIKLEETKCTAAFFRNQYRLSLRFRLRYIFDFRPCCLECHFAGAVLNEKESLLKQTEGTLNFPLDKYLIPVLGMSDYPKLAQLIRLGYYAESFRKDTAIDPEIWVREMLHQIKYGVFPENGALGEYFFNFGTANVIDENGKASSADINPGTIVLNREIVGTKGTLNSTIAHEGTHSWLGKYFFLLQRTHGHDYCSYMCKKYSEKAVSDQTSPLERMELQANIFPRFLLIPEIEGRKHAAALLDSYGGTRSLVNMQRMVNDMAEYYGTTKTMARSRLMDFGYNEARGILRTANGNLVPSYLSTLSTNETYTITESDAIQEYLQNPEFRQIITSGRYYYVPESGCYCLNDNKYLFFDQFKRDRSEYCT